MDARTLSPAEATAVIIVNALQRGALLSIPGATSVRPLTSPADHPWPPKGGADSTTLRDAPPPA